MGAAGCTGSTGGARPHAGPRHWGITPVQLREHPLQREVQTPAAPCFRGRLGRLSHPRARITGEKLPRGPRHPLCLCRGQSRPRWPRRCTAELCLAPFYLFFFLLSPMLWSFPREAGVLRSGCGAALGARPRHGWRKQRCNCGGRRKAAPDPAARFGSHRQPESGALRPGPGRFPRRGREPGLGSEEQRALCRRDVPRRREAAGARLCHPRPRGTPHGPGALCSTRAARPGHGKPSGGRVEGSQAAGPAARMHPTPPTRLLSPFTPVPGGLQSASASGAGRAEGRGEGWFPGAVSAGPRAAREPGATAHGFSMTSARARHRSPRSPHRAEAPAASVAASCPSASSGVRSQGPCGAAARPPVPGTARCPGSAMDFKVPVALGGGDPMDDDRPLFSTFKPVSEDKASRGVPAEPWRAEAPLGCQDTSGRLSPGSCPAPWDLAALRAQTRLWFEQTQARRLRAGGELPAWFHGFVSRRETEQLLQDQPPGCFLVRFSESTVGFVLSYRGRDRCRHFILEQLADGRYAILGEPSAHAELADLLRHYAAAPVTPYHEVLTVPRGRAPGVPANVGSPGPSSPTGDRAAAPEQAYARVRRDPVPAAPPRPPDAKYQQLMCFHTYTEPREAATPSGPRVCREPDEHIPFYAMGWGSAPSAGPEENVYSEVALARQELPRPLPQGAGSTLPPKARPPAEPTHRRLFRSKSSQASKRRKPPAAPATESRPPGPATEATTSPSLEFDDPVYGRRTITPKRAAAAAGQEALENIYEQVSGDRL
ncbi:SH2 domain-containing protein 2A isoform X1 [Dromaius novaehollandiae]